jgi:hypothetical protein
MQKFWYTALVCAICLEGLGRKYLPQIPSLVFYFLKDAVLLVGFVWFRPGPDVQRIVRYLYRGFGIALVAGIAWTTFELLNPEHESLVLGIIGLRSYWLWWIAPPIIAGFLQKADQKRRAVYVLSVISAAIAVLAALQFAAPANSTLNLYSVVDGEEVYAADMATVAATGRARVAGTFTFVSGFVDFCLLIPALLLSLGLEAKETRLRRIALIATMCTAAVVPMSGSRGSVLLGLAVLLVMAGASGLLFTRVGRRIFVAGILAAGLAAFAFPDAILGVQSRFQDTEETMSRVKEVGAVLPPVALAVHDYPFLGIGTGMQQNARFSLHAVPAYNAESEVGRYLVELGPIGYLIVWTSKLGLIVALLRSYAILKRAGRRGAAGAALSYAAITMFGNLTFDHVWQALYFLGCGFILAEVVAVMRVAVRRPEPVTAAADPLTLRPAD